MEGSDGRSHSHAADDVAATAEQQQAGSEKEVTVSMRAMEKEALELTAESGLSTAQVEQRRAEFGYNEVIVAQKNIYLDLLMRYLQPTPIIMFITIILAAAIQPSEWLSFALLLIEINLLVFSAWRSEISTNASMAEIADGVAPEIDVKRDDQWQRVKVRELVPGDIFLVKGGVVVPADAMLRGNEYSEPCKIDESSLTGEALAVTRGVGDHILSGAVVKQGELEAQVTSIGANTLFGKSMALLGEEREEGRLQRLTKRLQMVILFCGMVVCAVLFIILIFAPPQNLNFGDAVRLCFVVLVAGAPVTLPVVIATILAVGARELAREKAVVTRLSAIEELAGMDVLCSDKTGTLTLNQLELDEPYIAKGFSLEELYEAAVLSSKREGAEAIDTAIFGSCPNDILLAVKDCFVVQRFIPFNPSDKKAEATVYRKSDPTQALFGVCKGSPDVINKLCHASDPARMQEVNEIIVGYASRGLRNLGVARRDSSDGSWYMLGLLALFDPPRHDTKEVIEAANNLFVDVKMITGDQQAIAIETCARLGLGTSIMGPEIWHGKSNVDELATMVENVNGFAGVYPEHKYAVVEQLQRNNHVVGMTGDGVNDAPALKKAQVGIAVAGATEAAKGAADIILSEPGLSTIIVAIKRSRKTFLRLNFYVTYRIWASAYNYAFFFLLFVALRIRYPSWLIVLVSLFKDIVILATSLDKVPIAPSPQAWNMVHPTVVALLMGAISTINSVIFAYVALPQYGNWWHNFDIASLTQEQVNSTLFLNTLITFSLTVLSTRTKGFFLDFKRRPSVYLLVPAFVVPFLLTFMAVYLDSIQLGAGPAVVGCGWAAAGITWAYSIIWLFIVEAVKLMAYYLIEFESNLRLKREMSRKRAQREITIEMLKEDGLKHVVQRLNTDAETTHGREPGVISEHMMSELKELRKTAEDYEFLKAQLTKFVTGALSNEEFAAALMAGPPRAASLRHSSRAASTVQALAAQSSL
ncbi:Plasma membrane ATPase 4 [Porphyridium purpureum]|uniref:Plasma membrane ATPase n=1 Tax=Porphyridium purpureum TaxID=35688 RepID=A0A5J4Z5W2_PORPP|nr:Plasma membrane ATPase 4 [Porphyridium purpureum]|eukprot:POR1815..scf295_1